MEHDAIEGGDVVCYVCSHEDCGARVACQCRDMPICERCQAEAIDRVPSYRNGVCPQCNTRFHTLPSLSCAVHLDLNLLLVLFLVPASPPILLLSSDPENHKLRYIIFMYYALLLVTVFMVYCCFLIQCRFLDCQPMTDHTILVRVRPILL